MSEEKDNTVFIGKKPLGNYIRSIEMLFKTNNLEEVKIKSRGKFISKAADISEIAKRNLSNMGISTKAVKIASETFSKNPESKPTNISSIEIVLGK